MVDPSSEHAMVGAAGPARGLYLRADGSWLHDGEPVTHARLAALLHRSITREADGTIVVTTGRDRMPVTCEDTPLRVLSVEFDDAAVWLALSNEKRERLLSGQLWVDDDGSWRTRTADGLDARFSRAAVLQAAEGVREEGGEYRLCVGGTEWPLKGSVRGGQTARWR